MARLKMLKPKLPLAPTANERYGVAPPIRYRENKANPTGRDADPRRTIPLQSAAWRKLRERVLARDPICQECYRRGHITPATDVDHVNGDPSDNRMSNLQGLCHSCHSHKTMRERHGRKPVMGCDVNGLPIDPSHPWARIVSDLEKSRGADRARPPGPPCVIAKGKDHD